jgi:hypothetical protein
MTFSGGVGGDLRWTEEEKNMVVDGTASLRGSQRE